MNSREEWRAFMYGATTALALVLWLAYRADQANAADVAHWKREFENAKATVRTDSVEVVKWVTKTRTLRDTIDIRDTLQVIEYIAKTDTLRERCMACIASASRLAVTADTVFVKVAANERRFTDRFGVNLGYGALLDRDGRIRTGPTITASVKVWPWRGR